MMRIVLDTNVLVSAILSPRSAPAHIIRLVLDDSVNLAVSSGILDEAYRVFHYPKIVRLLEKHGVTPEQAESFIERLNAIAVVTPGELIPDVIRDDPSDNMFLACAVESESDYIISGDHHLTDLKIYRGITIVNPATFLAIVRLDERLE